MQYISPLALLEAPTAGQVAKKDILLAKKKMFAELELSGGNTVIIRGRELTKNDIIIFFDNLQQDDNLQFHVIVANDFVLRRFLEDNVLRRRQKFNADDIYHDPQFIEWISPYFFTSFRSFAEECLLKRKDDEWATLLAVPMLMNVYYTEEAWKGIEKNIISDLEDLYAFRKSKGDEGWEVIETIVNFRYISMLKLLPQGRFSMLLDEYALITMHCSVYVFNKINRSRGITMVENALVIVLSAHYRKLIVDKRTEMETIDRVANKKRGRRLSGRKFGLLIFYVCIVAGSAIYNASNDDNKDYNLTPANTIDSLQNDIIKNKLQQAKPNDTLTFYGNDAIPPQEELPKPADKANDTNAHVNNQKNK